MAEIDDDEDVGGKRDRSPPFPYLGLEQSIDLARRLYQVARGSEVRLSQIAQYWNTTPTSGALPRYAGALQGYGLIESNGSRESRKIRLTDVGKRILEDTRPGVADELKEAAALRPKLFSELFGLWGKSRPADDIARSALQFDHNFTPVAARRFLTVFDEAMSYVRVGGEQGSVASEEGQTAADSMRGSKNDAEEVRRASSAEPDLGIVEYRRDVFALDEGEATITVPRQMSRASFEDLVAWLDLVKRRIERSLDE